MDNSSKNIFRVIYMLDLQFLLQFYRCFAFLKGIILKNMAKPNFMIKPVFLVYITFFVLLCFTLNSDFYNLFLTSLHSCTYFVGSCVVYICIFYFFMNKLSLLIEELRQRNFEFSVICLQETWLRDEADLSLLQIPNYTWSVRVSVVPDMVA